MHVAAIEGPSGEAVFKAGGDYCWKTGSFKGWHYSYEWAKSGRTYPRVLVIWPETRVGRNVSQPGFWTIAHTAMVNFLDFDQDGVCTGKPSDYLFEQAWEALPILGKDPNDRHALFSLIDVVVQFGPELARQPVAPQELQRQLAGEPQWEMTATDKRTGQVTDESSI